MGSALVGARTTTLLPLSATQPDGFLTMSLRFIVAPFRAMSDFEGCTVGL
jgi:hypothetical protein